MDQQCNTTISENTKGVEANIGTDAVQKLSYRYMPDAGTFKIAYNSEITGSINYNASAIDIQDALNNLSGLSGVVITGTSPEFIITFQGLDSKQPQPTLVIQDSNLFTSSADVVITPCLISDGAVPANNLKDVSDDPIIVTVETTVDGKNPEPDWFGGTC